MSDQHTPGRLEAVGNLIRTEFHHGDPDRRGLLIAETNGHGDESKANARRIVACWNACEGMRTDIIERGGGVFDILPAVAKQRDELLAALENAQSQINHLIGYGGGTDGFDEFAPLIAKVTGGAT